MPDPNASHFALGDLDCDSLPEIIFQTGDAIYAWRSDGTPLPGWPINIVGAGPAPLIGDVDGDGYPDVVAIASIYKQLVAYDRHGQMLPHFPKDFATDRLIGVQPVLADIDADGRTEILVVTQPDLNSNDAPARSTLTTSTAPAPTAQSNGASTGAAPRARADTYPNPKTAVHNNPKPESQKPKIGALIKPIGRLHFRTPVL